MGEPLTPSALTDINPIFGVDASGNIASLTVRCYVDYANGLTSSGVRLARSFDVWPELTAAQKTAAQTFYNVMKAKAEAKYL